MAFTMPRCSSSAQLDEPTLLYSPMISVVRNVSSLKNRSKTVLPEIIANCIWKVRDRRSSAGLSPCARASASAAIVARMSAMSCSLAFLITLRASVRSIVRRASNTSPASFGDGVETKAPRLGCNCTTCIVARVESARLTLALLQLNKSLSICSPSFVPAGKRCSDTAAVMELIMVCSGISSSAGTVCLVFSIFIDAIIACDCYRYNKY